jgi:hypothetical protein
MKPIYKALIVMIVLFGVLVFLIPSIQNSPSWIDQDILIFLSFASVACVIFWALR